MKHTSEGNIKKRRGRKTFSLFIPDEDGVRKKKEELMQLVGEDAKIPRKKRENRRSLCRCGN